MGENRTNYGWLFALTVIAAILRVIQIQTAISWDEAIIYFWVKQNPFTWIVSYYENVGNHVFLTILTAWSYYLFGDSLWALRIPALLAGVAMVPASYLLARSLTNERTARLTASLTAGLNFLILYSVNERGYGLQATLVVTMLWAWLRYWESRFAWPYFALTVVTLTLALYTLPTTLFIVPAMAAIAIFFEPGIRELGAIRKGWATALPIGIAGILTFLLYLPIMLNAGMGGTVNNSYLKAQLTFYESYSELVRLSKQFWDHSLWGIPDSLNWLLGALIILGLIRSLVRKPPLGWFLVLTSATVVFALLCFKPAPVRAFVFYVPLCIILLAFGIDLLLPQKGRVNDIIVSSYFCCGLALAIGSASILSEEMLREASKTYGRERGAEELVAAMGQMLKPGDYVEHVIPQMVYWMERLNLPRFVEFDEPPFVKDGKRVFVIVRHLREPLEKVLKNTPFGSLKVLTLQNFEEPQNLGRYGDFDLYVYERKESIAGAD